MNPCSVIFVCLVVNQSLLCVGSPIFGCNGPIQIVSRGVFKNESIGDLIAIDLHHCKTKSIDRDAFQHMGKLQYLSLPNNDITDLNDTLQHVSYLKYIDFSKNKIHELKDGIFFNLTSVHRVYLAENRISSIEEGVFKDMVSLKTLSLANNNISELRTNTFINNTQLEQLDLSSNHIENLEKNIFKNLNVLQCLNLSSNQVHTINRELFSTLIKLHNLDLSNNMIQELEVECLINNKQLESLNLNNNKISHLDINLLTNQINVTHLRLENKSALCLLPNSDILENNKTKFELYLSDNPWTCDSQLIPLYIIWKNFMKSTVSDPQCATPAQLQNKRWSDLTQENFCHKFDVLPTIIISTTTALRTTIPKTISPTISLTTTTIPKNITAAKVNVQVDETIQAQPGENVLLFCIMHTEEVEWRYRNNIIQEHSVSASGQQYIIAKEMENESAMKYKLIIIDARIEDGGKYTCFSNKIEQQIFKLEVLESNGWMIAVIVIISLIIIIIIIVLAAVFAVKKYYKFTKPSEADTQTPGISESDPLQSNAGGAGDDSNQKL